MKRTIYYTIEKELVEFGGIEETTGHKLVRLYEINLDVPKCWNELSMLNTDPTEETIQSWMNDNGYSERDYVYVEL